MGLCANCSKQCPLEEITSCLLNLDGSDDNERLTILEVIAELFGVSNELQCLLVTCHTEEDVPHLCQQCLQILSSCLKLRNRFLSLCRPGSTFKSVFGNRSSDTDPLYEQYEEHEDSNNNNSDEQCRQLADDIDNDHITSEQIKETDTTIAGDRFQNSDNTDNKGATTKAFFEKFNLKECSVVIKRISSTPKIKTEPEEDDEAEFIDEWDSDDDLLLKEEIDIDHAEVPITESELHEPFDVILEAEHSLNLKTETDNTSNSKFSCSNCPELFSFQAELLYHILAVHRSSSSSSKSIACSQCSYTTTAKGRSALRRHMFTHTGERRFPCPYKNCDYFSNRSDRLQKHVTSKHNEPLNIQQNHEGAVAVISTSESGPRLRVRSKCTRCAKVFSNEIQMKKHEKTHSEKSVEENGFDSEGSPDEKDNETMGAGDDSDCELSSNSDQDTDTEERPSKKRTKTVSENDRIAKFSFEKNYERIIPDGDPSFSCQQCSKSFHFDAELKFHIQVDHTDHARQTHCTICDYKTPRARRRLLKGHFFCHTQEKLFRCLIPECEFESATKRSIINHSLRSHTFLKQKSKNMLCQYCGTFCNGSERFTRHMWKRHREEALKQNIDLSDIDMDVRKRRHRRKLQRIALSYEEYAQGDAKRFKCLERDCSYDCGDVSEIRIHSGTHGSDAWKKFPCNQCGCRFRTTNNLRSHLWVHSNNLYKCSKCSANFWHLKNLRNHYRRVHDCDPPLIWNKPTVSSRRSKTVIPKYEKIPMQETFACDQCPRKFKLQAWMFAHMQIDHSSGGDTTAKFRCHLCDFMSVSGSETGFRIHYMSRHTKEKRFRCLFPECHHQTVEQTSMVRHYQMHKNNVLTRYNGNWKKLICEFCGKVYVGQNVLDIHVKSKHHDKQLPYKCSQCVFSTAYKCSLVTHMKHMHPELAEQNDDDGHKIPTFSCEKCPFKTKWKGALVTHQKKCRSNPNHISRRGRVPHRLQKNGIAK